LSSTPRRDRSVSDRFPVKTGALEISPDLIHLPSDTDRVPEGPFESDPVTDERLLKLTTCRSWSAAVWLCAWRGSRPWVSPFPREAVVRLLC